MQYCRDIVSNVCNIVPALQRCVVLKIVRCNIIFRSEAKLPLVPEFFSRLLRLSVTEMLRGVDRRPKRPREKAFRADHYKDLYQNRRPCGDWVWRRCFGVDRRTKGPRKKLFGRITIKTWTETENRAWKVSGTQGKANQPYKKKRSKTCLHLSFLLRVCSFLRDFAFK